MADCSVSPYSVQYVSLHYTVSLNNSWETAVYFCTLQHIYTMYGYLQFISIVYGWVQYVFMQYIIGYSKYIKTVYDLTTMHLQAIYLPAAWYNQPSFFLSIFSMLSTIWSLLSPYSFPTNIVFNILSYIFFKTF